MATWIDTVVAAVVMAPESGAQLLGQHGWVYLAVYEVPSVLLLAAVLLALLGIPFFKKHLWYIAGLGALVFVVKTLVFCDSARAVDHSFFWNAGRVAWRGENPYDHGVVNPPTAVPIFMLLALLPRQASYVGFTIVNIVLLFSLVFLAYRVLLAQGEAGRLTPAMLLALSVAVALSHAAHMAIQLGQLPIIVAGAVLLALWAEASESRVGASALLAIATAKVGTVLPFLLIPLRRRNWRTLALFAAAVLLLSVAVPGPKQLPAWLAGNVRNIALNSAPGHVNDLGSGNAWSIISLDAAFFSLGIRDLHIVNVLQLLAVAALGSWIAWQAVITKRWPVGLVSSMLALYATLFLYHRTYDAIVLALPLTYAALHVTSERGAARRAFGLAAVAMVAVLYSHPAIGIVFDRLEPAGVAGRVLASLLRSHRTWLILATMAVLPTGVASLCRAAETDQWRFHPGTGD